MSFDHTHRSRWQDIMQPAIEAEPVGGLKLKAVRVDIRRSGDSILTDIADGIAHSQLVLADISITNTWRPWFSPWRSRWTRNGNVMYEVGLACACRQPVEVLLIRDDSRQLLFDLSSIPVLQYDPGHPRDAIERIRAAIADRLRERQLVRDYRVTALADSLGQQELNIVRAVHGAEVFSWPGGSLPAAVAMGLPRLLEKRIVRLAAAASGSAPDTYTWTPLGRAVAAVIVGTA